MRLLFIGFIFFVSHAQADTIRNYMGIANNIPQMEIKADPQAQAWARSARNVLTITCESIQETMMQANEMANAQGHPIFCLPPGTEFNALTLNELIQQTYKEISSQQSDKDSMTVSQVAWLGVTRKYQCQTNAAKQEMAQVAAVWGGQQQLQPQMQPQLQPQMQQQLQPQLQQQMQQQLQPQLQQQMEQAIN